MLVPPSVCQGCGGWWHRAPCGGKRHAVQFISPTFSPPPSAPHRALAPQREGGSAEPTAEDQAAAALGLMQGGDSQDQVLSIEELAERFNVSTKTISRWRDHGLVAQRTSLAGRRRVGFLVSDGRAVHAASNPSRIERGSRFSQLSEEEHDKIVSWARRLAAVGALPGRRPPADRQQARPQRRDDSLHDQAARSGASRDRPSFRLPTAGCGRRAAAASTSIYLGGESVESIARRYRRSKASIYRVILAQRAEHVKQLPLDFMPNAAVRP